MNIASSSSTDCLPSTRKIVCLSATGLDVSLELGLSVVGYLNSGIEENTVLNQYVREIAPEMAPVGSWLWPNLQAIRRLQPDLILGWRFPHRIYQRWLEGLAPTHLMCGAGYEVAIARLRTVAQLTDRVEAGEEAIAQLEQSITHLKQTYQRYPRKTVLIMGGSRPSRLVNRYPVEAETGTLGSVLKQFTYFPWKKPDPNKGEAGLMYLPLKKIVAVNPDVIFVQSYGKQSLASQLANSSTWQQLRAVRRQRVYEIGQVWHWGNGTRLIKVMLERLLPLIYLDAL